MANIRHIKKKRHRNWKKKKKRYTRSQVTPNTPKRKNKRKKNKQKLRNSQAAHSHKSAKVAKTEATFSYESLRSVNIHVFLVGNGESSRACLPHESFYSEVDPDLFQAWHDAAKQWQIGPKCRIVTSPTPKALVVATTIAHALREKMPHKRQFAILGELEYQRHTRPYQALRKISRLVGKVPDLIVVMHPLMMYSFMGALYDAVLGRDKKTIDEILPDTRYIIIRSEQVNWV